MKCKICNSENTKIIYNGQIRNDGLGKYTKQDIPMYHCADCNVIWHDNVLNDAGEFYESKEYRESLDGSSNIDNFYELHDGETLDKLIYTVTGIFRNKTVADIGCGGAFMDIVREEFKNTCSKGWLFKDYC
jgi:hypothetical protein